MSNTKKIITVTFFILTVFLPISVQAKPATVNCSVLPQDLCNKIVIESNTNDPNKQPDENPILASVTPLIDFITNILIGLFGAILVGIVIFSGIKMSASAGNEQVVKNAREDIFKGSLGLLLIISFRAIFGLFNTVLNNVTTYQIFENNAKGVLKASGIPLLISNIIGIALFFAGVVSTIFLIVGGIRYIVGAGNEQSISAAKRTITYSVAGLVISVSAYAIINFVVQQLAG